jgi:sterol desaturase/sphingolipid hydroxylase (fatty acid hydroxylase superfamily)
MPPFQGLVRSPALKGRHILSTGCSPVRPGTALAKSICYLTVSTVEFNSILAFFPQSFGLLRKGRSPLAAFVPRFQDCNLLKALKGRYPLSIGYSPMRAPNTAKQNCLTPRSKPVECSSISTFSPAPNQPSPTGSSGRAINRSTGQLINLSNPQYLTFAAAIMDDIRQTMLILISTPLYLLVIGLEILLSNMRQQPSYTLKDTVQNIYLMLLNGVLDLVFRSIYIGVILTFFYEHRLGEMHTGWLYWLLLLMAEDFMYYWLHRVDHQCRLFWATHVTHHSSEQFNLTVGFRSSVMEPLYRFVYFIPIAALGFKPLDIALVYSATQIWGILVHTEKIHKLGWLEYVLVTPSHHRVHHASNPKYLDKNMGMLLIIWDKLFGTFQPELPEEEYQPVKYGLTKSLEAQNPVHVVFHEWKNLWTDLRRKDISLKEKTGYLLGPPGWSHDGSRHTSDQLREKEYNQLLENKQEAPAASP